MYITLKCKIWTYMLLQTVEDYPNLENNHYYSQKYQIRIGKIGLR